MKILNQSESESLSPNKVGYAWYKLHVLTSASFRDFKHAAPCVEPVSFMNSTREMSEDDENKAKKHADHG